MATIPFTPPGTGDEIDYPSGDNRPVGETPRHINNMVALRDALDRYYAGNPNFFAAASMFVYYVRGERLKHVSPDVFVVFGVPRDKPRKKYLVWEEGGHTPDLVIELTSASTRDEDVDDKMWLYRHKLGVREYILFDPYDEYLNPPLQGYRLEQGEYVPIESVGGRLPSQVLGGLQFERDEGDLRIYDPATSAWLPTEQELRLAAEERASRIEAERIEAQKEIERLRQEIAALRRRSTNGGNGNDADC